MELYGPPAPSIFLLPTALRVQNAPPEQELKRIKSVQVED
jgi:hypothetical protein